MAEYGTTADSPATRPPRLRAYGVALVVAVVGQSINAWLAPVLVQRGLLLVPLAAVFLAASYGGLGPGCLATLLLAAGTWYVHLLPAQDATAFEWQDIIWLGLFVALGLVLSLLSEWLLLTRQRYAEALVRRERALARLDSLFDSASVGLVLLDRDLRFTRVNRIAAEASGLPIAAHIGRTVKEVQPGMPDDVMRRLQHVLDTGEPMPPFEVALELRGQPKGQQHWQLSATPIRSADGAIVGLAGVRVDVTDLRQAEADARQAVADREELMAIVSHDLKSPLTAILLNAGLIRQKAPDVARQVDGIERAGRQMQQLIADILDVNRARQGRMTLNLAPVPIWELVGEAVEALKPQAAAKSLRLIQDIASDVGCLVGDHRRLLQVLRNLIDNAVRFTPEHGTVSVDAKVVGAHVCICVSDTGPGIPADQHDLIFERFWQAKKAERQGYGSGLGLAIAKGIVDAHQGSIAVCSDPGEGATFRVILPRHGPPVALQTA